MSIFKGANVTTRADRISTFQATTCDFGTAVPYIFGTCKLGANLIEYRDFETKERRTTTKSGKSKSTQIDYLYYAKLVLAIGEGNENYYLGNIWVNNSRYGSLGVVNASGQAGAGLTYAPNGNKPYDTDYTGLSLCYGRVFLGENSASVPSYSFEVYGSLRDTGNGKDANLADVIKYLLGECGMQDYIDQDSFNRFKNFCYNADLLVSTPTDYFSKQKNAQEIIKELLDLANTYMFWSVDRFKFVPRYPAAVKDYIPDTTIQYEITKNDYRNFSFKRADSSQQYNVVKVNFTNRANDYETESISFINVEDVRIKGTKQVEVNAAWLHNKEAAVKFAKMKAEQYINEVTTYNFDLDWAFCRLEPGDLIRIKEDTLAINEIVRISKVIENANGTLKVEAISTPIESYAEAAYTVRDDYQYVDFNVDGGSIDTPLFIVPPSDLMTSNAGVELWIALRGQNDKWGGCGVYASRDDESYAEAGIQPLESLYGKVISDNDTTIEIRLGNIEQKALIDNQKVWINGEVLTYEKAVLTAFNTYTLTGLERGLHGTIKAIHATNDDFAVLDSSLFCLQFNKSDIGQTAYLRFPSFNVFKAANEDVNLVDTYAVMVRQADLPNCQNIRAFNKYRELADNVSRYDIVIDWDVPQGMASYQQAQVWYKTSNAQAVDISHIQEGQAANEIGYTGSWLYGGQGYNSVVLPQAVIGDTYKIAVCCEDIYGNVELPDESPQIDVVVALKTEIPNTPANLSVNITDKFNISWDEVRNADIKYYELRTDTNVGVESANLIARTTECAFSTDAIHTRTGLLYLFAVNVYSKASAPASVNYNFPKPRFIGRIGAVPGIKQITLSVDNIPSSYLGVHWFVDTDDFKVNTLKHLYSAEAGVHTVNACYYDYFGDGDKNADMMVTVSAYIDASLIEEKSLTAKLLDDATQQALEKAKTAAQESDVENIVSQQIDPMGESISTIVANLSKSPAESGYSAITQLAGGIQLTVSKGEAGKGSFINLTNKTLTLDANLITIGNVNSIVEIPGTTITNDMLAGSISADKLNVTSLSAISATIGTLRTKTSGSRLEINDNYIEVYSHNDATGQDVLRVRLGVWD